MMAPTATARGRAFTLIELLTVVAIIAIVISMLLPALAKGRQRARSLQCTGDLRQLGIATHLYWADHDGRTFPYRSGARDGGVIYWFGWMGPGHEGERQFDFAQGALYPYLRGRGIEICPALRYVSPRFKLKSTGAAFGYGYNFNLSTQPSKPPIKSDQIRQPESLALLADSAQVNTFQAPASPERPMLEEFYYFNEVEPTVHFRHRQLANVLFCDGHVSAHKPAPGSEDLRLPEQTVARLPSSMLIP